jgi:hypothetical protein
LLSPLAVQRDHVRPWGQTLEDASALRQAHLLRGAAVHVLLGDLYYLDGEIAAEALSVVVATVGGPPL